MPQPVPPTTIDNKIKTQLGQYVTAEIERGIRRNFDAITDPAAFLADNLPAPPTTQFAKSIVRRVCRTWARNETPIKGPLADFTYGSLCTPYLISISENPTLPSLPAIRDGGQCATLYAFTVNYLTQLNNADGTPRAQSGPQVLQLQRTGPIPTPSLVFSGSCPGGPKRFDIFIGGVSEFASEGDCFQGRGFNTSGTRITSVLFNRLDGGPDDCGNASPVYVSPQPRDNLSSITPAGLTFPSVGSIPISVSFDDDGNITVDFPTLDYSVKIPNPLVPLDGETGGELGVGEQGSPGELSPSSPDETEGEEEDKNLVGIKVLLSGIPPRANALFNSSSVYYKGAYFVSFGGEGGYQHSNASIVTTDEFFYAPPGCNKWRVIPNRGYSVRVQPFTVE